jgi:hypothetical protein
MTTMASTRPAPEGLYGPWPVSVAPATGEAPRARQPRPAVPPKATAGGQRRPPRRYCTGECGRPVARSSRTGLCRECRKAANAKVPCTGTACTAARAQDGPAAGAFVDPGNKTGQCRACWREGLAANAAKTEPEEQAAMLARMVESFARRAGGEDPGRGLAALLELARRVDRAVDGVGMSLAESQGTSAVADDLGWDRRRVDKRWGPAARRERGW